MRGMLKRAVKRALRGPAKVGKVMGEFKEGTLKSSSGAPVTERKQAVAIGMSEAGMSNKNYKAPRKGY